MMLPSDSMTLVRDAIRHWIDLLSTGNDEEAAMEIRSQHDPCSGQLLVDAIGRFSRKFREAPADEKQKNFPEMTSPKEMDLSRETFVIYVKDEASFIDCDLPIEGLWSDLTAKFRFARSSDCEYELSRFGMRVL